METVLKTITIREFLDAMEKNGFRKGRNAYIVTHKNKLFQIVWVSRAMPEEDKQFVARACAFGQAAINLGVSPARLDTAIHNFNNDLGTEIINLNDRTGKSVPEIARLMKEKYANVLDREITIEWYARA